MKGKNSAMKLTLLLTLITLAVVLTANIDQDNRIARPFSIIIFPDTQIYSKDDPAWRNSSRKEVFMAMTKWVAEHARQENIRFVLHMGDIVNEDFEPYEWHNADEAMSILDGVVPYCFTLGNHDMAPEKPGMTVDSIRNTINFNKTFPYTRYINNSWFGGRMINDPFIPYDTWDNSFHFFSEGNLEFMIVSLEAGPTNDMLSWADSLISSSPSKRVILITHSYMLPEDIRDYPGGFGYLPGSGNTGEEIWQKLVQKHENIFFVMSGHAGNNESHRGLLASKGLKGNTVYQQLNGDSYDGWLRILRFVPAENKIYVTSFSPWKPADPQQQLVQYKFPLPGWNRDSTHQYELFYKMCDN